MVDIRIYNPSGFDGQPDERHITLGIGTHVFGSSLDCDVVLLDDGVLPSHFKLFITESSGVMFELLPDIQEGSRDLPRHEVDTSTNMTRWNEGDELKAGSVTITLSDLPVAETAPRAVAAVRTTIPKPLSATIFGGICFIILVILLPENSVDINQVKRASLGVNPVENSPVLSAESLQTLVDRKTPRDILLSEGVVVEKQTEDQNGWQIKAYVKNSSVKERVRSILAMYPTPVKAEIFDESAMSDAVSMILDAMASNVTISRLSRGEVVLDGMLPDDEAAKQLERSILSDVFGVQSIRFTHNSLIDNNNLMDQIQGIWAGQNPYVAWSDGNLIYPGQYLTNGVLLVEVKYNSILVESNKLRKKIEIKN